MKVNKVGMENADDGNLLMGCTKGTDKNSPNFACPGYMPMDVMNAAKACACENGNTCSIMWKYY